MSVGIMSERCDSLKTAWQLMFPIAGAAAVRRFARDSRGAAALELALGAVTLVATAALCFDIYSRITADTALARMAVTMADYISLEVDPEEEQMRALGEFLNEHELGVPADLVYVVTAIHQPPGSPPPAVQVLWKHDQIQIGNTAITAALATDCARHVDAGNTAKLPAGFAMLENEVVIISEVCARLTVQGSLTGTFVDGDIYRLHALPFRDSSQLPARPRPA